MIVFNIFSTFFATCGWGAVGFLLVTFCLHIYCRKKRDYDSIAFLDLATSIASVAVLVCLLCYLVTKGIQYVIYGWAV